MEHLRATDPHLYDSPELDWHSSGAEKSSSRVYYRELIDEVLKPGSLKDMRVLDIGSGVGQLFNWLKEKGVAEVVAIDPSQNNTQTTKTRYPWVESIETTLQEYAQTGSQPFDAAFAIYVFEHIRDLNEAFACCSALLKIGGMLFLIIGDKDHNLSSDLEERSDKFVSVKVLNQFDDGTVETEIHYKNEQLVPIVMYDIFRPVSLVRAAAENNGFSIEIEKPVLGPRHKPSQERKHTVIHLFVFKKVR